jgi:hypothetical protein
LIQSPLRGLYYLEVLNIKPPFDEKRGKMTLAKLNVDLDLDEVNNNTAIVSRTFNTKLLYL